LAPLQDANSSWQAIPHDPGTTQELVLHRLAIRLCYIDVVVYKCTARSKVTAQKCESIIKLFMDQSIANLPTGHPGNEYQFQIM
jgi:hypothetical protein